MATYTSDLTANVLSACDAVTGWSELPSPHASGSAPAADTENYFQNGTSVSQASGQATGQGAGIQYDNGADLTWTAASNWCFFVWTFYAAPTNLLSWANSGMMVGIGSADNNADLYKVGGNNFGDYPYGGWQNSCFDPEFATPDQSIGTPGAAYRNFAVLPNITAKITKGSPLAVDVIRYGRGQIKATGTAADFAGMATFNDNSTTGRYGLFADRGTYEWKGLMSLGDSTTSVTFSDSNKTINVEDTPRVLAGFNKIEIDHASSSVTWDTVSVTGKTLSITGSAPVSRGDFEVLADATVDFDSCTFTDLGSFIFWDNAATSKQAIDGSIFRRCGEVDTGNAVFTNTLFTNSHAANSVTTDDLATLVTCTFASDGSNHAVELTGAAATFSWTGTATGYDTGTSGTGVEVTGASITGNETIHITATTGTFIINVADGATIPSVSSAGASVNVVAGLKTFSFTVNPAITGYEWRIYVDSGVAGELGTTELDGEESATLSTQSYSYSYTADTNIVVQIISNGYEELVHYDTLTAADKSVTLNLTLEENV